ncbi:MAG: hypothetical protein IPM82_28810 [Saprospiraceae bacterium]|nr:hypothetical protein [Saprospiraceae bacterium]
MKQPDFFRLFSEKMQGATPPPDFSGDDWSALQTRLDAHDQKRWRVLPLGWLAGLTGLLLLSNLGWFLLWQKTGDDVAKLRSELPVTKAEAVTLRDTVYEKLVVYQYDTIYRTVVVRQMRAGNLAETTSSKNTSGTNYSTRKTSGEDTASLSGESGEHPNLPPSNASADNISRISKEGLPKTGNPFSQNKLDSFAENALAHLLPERLPNGVIHPFPLTRRLPRLSQANDLIMLPVKQKTTAFPLIPQSFTLGIGVGGLVPKQASIASSSSVAASLSGEIGFSDQLALTLDGSFAALQFRGYVQDPGLGLPPFQSPGDDYVLKYFETHDEAKSILQLAVGMRWYFFSKSKLNPWLGAGWTAQWNPAYELEVEYTHSQTGVEKSRETSVPAMQKPLNYAGFNLGIRYRLATHWHLQAGSSWDFKVGSQSGIGRWWGWRAGASYQF